jgi:hypothetical protein
MAVLSGKIEPISVECAFARAGPGRPRGLCRSFRQARAAGRRRGSLGIAPTPQAPRGRPGCRLDVVGTWGQGMVDPCPVRCGVAAVRSGGGSGIRQRRRGPLGRGDLLHRLTVLHVGCVFDLSGSGGRRPQAPGAARRRFSFSSPAGSTGGRRRCSLWGPFSSTSAPETRCGVDLTAQAAHQHV